MNDRSRESLFCWYPERYCDCTDGARSLATFFFIVWLCSNKSYPFFSCAFFLQDGSPTSVRQFLFFYLIHIPLIRVTAKAYYFLFEANPPFLVFYLIWMIIIVTLYMICMKYRSFKASYRMYPGYWWLKYF